MAGLDDLQSRHRDSRWLGCREGIIAMGVGSNFFLGTAGIDDAILRDVVVVTDGVEASGLVTGFEVVYREIFVYTRGTAMYHD